MKIQENLINIKLFPLVKGQPGYFQWENDETSRTSYQYQAITLVRISTRKETS